MATPTDHLPVEDTNELPPATRPFPTTLERPLEPEPPLAAPEPVSAAAAAPQTAPPRPSWWVLAGAVALAIIIAALSVWLLMAQRLHDIDPQQVITRNLADAEQALLHGRYIDPPERSALHYYSTVLAIAPDNPAAQAGLDAIAQRFIDDARVLLADRRIAEAGVAMEKARRVRPDHAGLTALNEQLRAELKRLVADTQAIDTGPAPEPATGQHSASAMPAPRAQPSQSSRPATGEIVRAPTQAPITPPAGSTQTDTTTASPPVIASADASRSSRSDAAATPAAQAAASATTPANPTMAPAPMRQAAATPAGSSTSNQAAPPRQLLKMVQPDYPQNAVMRGMEGWVDVRMQVNAQGDVLRPEVVHTEGGRVFNRPALQAVRQWKYEARPGATPEDLQVRIEFKLEQ